MRRLVCGFVIRMYTRKSGVSIKIGGARALTKDTAVAVPTVGVPPQ